MASVAHEWETLRGKRARGEVGEDVYLRRCEELSDSLRVGRESGASGGSEGDSVLGSFGTAAAEELAYRIDLLRCLESEVRGDGLSEVVAMLPRLWTAHLDDPVRFPAHPDGVGGDDGSGLANVFDLLWQDIALNAALIPSVSAEALDELTTHAFDALETLGRPESEITEARLRVLLAVGRFDEAQEVVDSLAPPSLSDNPTWEEVYSYQRDMDVRAMIALQRGELETATEIIDEMVSAPETRAQPTVMLAESIAPLAGLLPAEVTATRVSFVADRAAGEPVLSDALLQVAEFLAQTGRERTALGLVDRLLPMLGLSRRDPGGDVHLLAGLHTVYAAAEKAGFGELRPTFAGLPAVSDWVARIGWDAQVSDMHGSDMHGSGMHGSDTAASTVAALAAWTGARAREGATALDRRNGNDMESTVGLGLHRLPEAASASELADTPLDSRVLAATPPMPLDLPRWIEANQFEIPGEVADWDGAVSGRVTPEIPVVGPVDLARFGEQDAVTATMLYSMLGLPEAVAAGVDRLVELRESGEKLELGVLIDEMVRRYEMSVSAEGSDDAEETADETPEDPEHFDDTGDTDDTDDIGDTGDSGDSASTEHPLVADVDRVLRSRQEAQEDAEAAGASPAVILSNRVQAIAAEWDDAKDITRAIIEQDILMGGVFPDHLSMTLAVRALRRVTRYAPRAVPQVGAGLMVGIAQIGGNDPEAVCAVAQYTAAVALALPEPPGYSSDEQAQLAGEAAPSLLDDLVQLGLALAGSGAYFEALSVYDRALVLLSQAEGVGTDCPDGEDGSLGALGEDTNARRVHLVSCRADVLGALGNYRAAAENYSEAAANAEHWALWEYVAESQVRCVSACLDDRDFPRAAMIIDGFDEIDGLDWMLYPGARFRREVQATRLASALTDENFEDGWQDQVQLLDGAYDYLARSTSSQQAATELVEGVLVINRGLVHTDRVDAALKLTAWAAGEAKSAENEAGSPETIGGPGADPAASAAGAVSAGADSGEDNRAVRAVAAARLEALTEEALLLHVQGRDEAAMMIFESVVQQARRAEAPWLVEAVSHRVAAASRYAADESVRARYAELMQELAL